MLTRLQETISYIQSQYDGSPGIGIILGTGLGGLVNKLQIEKEFGYKDLPHFPVSTVESHSGRLLFGRLRNKYIVVMQGRFHYYEGYSMQEIVYPVRVMKLLGVNTLLITNVSGGVNLKYRKGDLMILDDHINLQSDNPLRGINHEELGPRFPDMSAPYDPDLRDAAWKHGKDVHGRMHIGTYIAVNGPSLETRAEYRFLHKIGGDAVGMSTVPEVIAARHMGMKVVAMSLITDECDPDNLSPVNFNEIIQVARNTEPKMTEIICRLVSDI